MLNYLCHNSSGGGGFEGKKEEKSLLGRRRKVAGGVPIGTGKIDVWLLATTVVETRWLL
jgi:hypothetical protein